MKPIYTILYIVTALLLCCPCSVFASQPAKWWNLEDIHIRDPYILPVEATRTYYLYRTSDSIAADGSVRGGVEVFTSKDLKRWYGPQLVFRVPADNWITGAVWAPEVHHYRGKYYLFATLNSPITWKKERQGWPAYTFRGTQIFYADRPEGPFKAFSPMPHTPMDWMALDGTLYEENGVPYMVFCHEWVQLTDGTMDVVPLKADLSAPAAPPMRLFCASDAPWSTGKQDAADLPTYYVTDGCFLYRSRTGRLLMIWSSYCNGQYAVGVAQSATGRIAGPWVQQSKPLFSRNGGHGMLFSSFDGKLYIVLHGPNEPSGAERAHLFEIEDLGNTLILK